MVKLCTKFQINILKHEKKVSNNSYIDKLTKSKGLIVLQNYLISKEVDTLICPNEFVSSNQIIAEITIHEMYAQDHFLNMIGCM